MDDDVRRALAEDRVCEITTRGRRSGEPRRIEIWFWQAEGGLYLTGAPGAARHWYRNLLAEPAFTFHLKEGATADLAARARPVHDEAERRRLLEAILAQIDGDVPDHWIDWMPPAGREAIRANLAEIARTRDAQLPLWLAESPLVEIRLGDEVQAPPVT